MSLQGRFEFINKVCELYLIFKNQEGPNGCLVQITALALSMHGFAYFTCKCERNSDKAYTFLHICTFFECILISFFPLIRERRKQN